MPLPIRMKFFVSVFVALFACNCSSASPCLGGLGNLLGGIGKLTGGLSKVTGTLTLGGVKGNQGFQGNQICERNQRVQQVQQILPVKEENAEEIKSVTSELDEVFELIVETAESVENTKDIVSAVRAVADVAYATLAVISNVNSKVLNDPNAFCELCAYLDAAVEKLLETINGVVTGVAAVVKSINDEFDIATLKWIIEAVVAVGGNITNASSSILENTIDVAEEKNGNANVENSASLTSLASALSGVGGKLKSLEATENHRCANPGTIRAVDLRNTLLGVSSNVSSLISGLGLTNIAKVVDGLVGSVSGSLSGLLNGISGTLSGTLNAVGGIAGGIVKSLSVIAGESNGIVTQLTSQVSGVANILSDVTLSLTQVITVAVTVIGKVSTVTNSLAGILKSLETIGNVGASGFKILPCKGAVKTCSGKKL